MYFVLSALMLILFDFSHLLRHFSSLFISSVESITLSPGTQVESVLPPHDILVHYLLVQSSP